MLRLGHGATRGEAPPTFAPPRVSPRIALVGTAPRRAERRQPWQAQSHPARKRR